MTIIKVLSNDQIAVNKTNSSVVKTTNDRDNLKEHIDNLNTTDIDITRGNYSNSTAIKILDDVAKSPTDSNVRKPMCILKLNRSLLLIYVFFI